MSKVNLNVPQGDKEKENEKKAQGCVGIIVTLCAIAAIGYSVYVLLTV